MNHSNEYRKWRFLISLAYADKRLMREERDFLERKIQEQASEGYHQRLLQEMHDDMFDPKPPDFHYYKISTPEDKVDLLMLAHGLFWVDNDLDAREKIYLEGIMAELKKDEDALELLREVLPSWDHDVGEKCLRSYVERMV